MKTSTKSVSCLTRILLLLPLFFLISQIFSPTQLQAQIYEPEGLNMPGAWNTWTNPPANNLALASSTQVPGGLLTKIATGTPRWQTMLKVAATGGDLTAGSYEWLFTSGPTANAFQNKWSMVNVIIDSLQLYTKEGANNNNMTLVDGFWYTMNWEDIGYADTRAIFMATSGEPVEILTVSTPVSVAANEAATINIGLSANKSAEEIVFIRYSTDAWATSSTVPATVTGMNGIAQIPGQPGGTVVSYYAFTSTKQVINADYDLYTIHLQNNSGVNYTYTVASPPPVITFANLQWPASGIILPGVEFNVYGRAEIPGITGQTPPASGLQVWVGYNTTNTDPATWTNWLPAGYCCPVLGLDEYFANLGAVLTTAGSYYYATRFSYNSGSYLYGGYSSTGGGFWDGVANVSGVVDIVVGMDEETFPGLRIYPNPAADFIVVEIRENARLTITNMLGNTVLNQDLTAGHHTINISNLKSGLFHMQVSSNDRTARKTILKR